MTLTASRIVQVPLVTTVFSCTFPLITLTVNPIPNVELFKSGVEVSVHAAPLLSQVAMTVPNLLAPVLLTTQ
jgi:hypothetical protein